MGRKYQGVTARKSGIQMSFNYKGHRVREHFRVEPNVQNMKAIHRRREAVLLDIELDRFDYYQHFPQGRNAHIFGQENDDSPLFSEWLNQWLIIQQQRLSYSTIRDYCSIIKHHLIPSFGGITLKELTNERIQNWLTRLDVSPKRKNNILVPLRLSLDLAVTRGKLASNPTSTIKNFPLDTREPKPFSLEEIEQILSFMEPLGRNYFQFAFFSGLRTSELLALEWHNVDFEKNRIYVRSAIVRNKKKNTKTAAGSRTVNLNEKSLEAIQNQQKRCPISVYVFEDDRNPGKPLDDQKVRKRYWIPALKDAGIDYRSPYQTRHTFASRELDSGKSPSCVFRTNLNTHCDSK